MKKNTLIIACSLIVLCVLVVSFIIFGRGGTNKLDKIVEKFNNCETVTTYKEYGYDLSASKTKDTLKVSSATGETKSTVEFKLNGNILSNENLSSEDMMIALLVIDSVGQTIGYKDGELAKNMNAFSEEIKAYTLEKEGFELKSDGNKNSLKIDLSKKIPLISMDNFYLKADDFDMISKFIAEKTTGNQSGKNGNVAYDVFVDDEESTIKIGQDEKLGNSAYKSILSALEVMYGEETANHFQELYPKFIDGTKTVDRFTIETNYTFEDQNESVFKDTKVVLVTIKNSN